VHHNTVHHKTQRRSNAVPATGVRRSFAHGKRARGRERSHKSFFPPENWYEPHGERRPGGYEIVVQDPGEGYRHAVTPDEVRNRLRQLPSHMVEPLEVVQLSRMTRKKQTVPCYGMQWGASLYLYPIEDTLEEYFTRPPLSVERREAEMYGGRWNQVHQGLWRLVWTRETIRDFYLNNILLHELGHLLDDRNHSYADRERYADWFAIEFGYRPTRRPKSSGRVGRRRVRRHAH
jgi:hypothetical protein